MVYGKESRPENAARPEINRCYFHPRLRAATARRGMGVNSNNDCKEQLFRKRVSGVYERA